MKLLIPFIFFLFQNENYKKRDKNKCKIIPKNAIQLYGIEHKKIYNLFMRAIKEYAKYGVTVNISQYDLFHFHYCKNNIIIFHCKEYPKNSNWNLGYCQIGSDITMKNFDKRNLLFDLNLGIFYIDENTNGLLYKDCESSIDYYIDPITFNTYYIIRLN